MAEFSDRFGELLGPDDDRAFQLIMAWLRAKRLQAGAESGDCPALEALAAFVGGSLEVGETAAVLSHLSGCRRCRVGVDMLLRRARSRPLWVFHLPSLRNNASGSAGELRAWLARVVKCERFDESGISLDILFPGEAFGFQLLSPPAIDRRGTFSVEISVPGAGAALSVLVALEDHEQRLELCSVPVADSKASVLADVHFLDPPAGPVPPRLLDLSLLPIEEARRWWSGPRMLGTLGRLVEPGMDPLDVFDAFAAMTCAAGEQWRVSLRSEIAALPDPAAGLAVVQSVLQSLNQFATTWRESNGVEHPRVAECVSALLDVTQSTHRPRRGRTDEQPDSTVRPPGRKKSRETSESGEEK